MKIFNRYSASLLMATAVLAGCDSDEMQLQSESTGTILQITAEIGEQSRSLDNRTSFANNDKIGIFLSTGKGEDCKLVENISATLVGGKWTLSKNIDLSDYPQGLNVMAYYPFNGLNPTFDAQNMLIQYPGLDINNFQTDILTSSHVVATSNSSTANLKFSHTLSCVTLKVSKGSALNSSGKLVQFVLNDIATVSDETSLLVSNGVKSWVTGEPTMSTYTRACNAMLNSELTYEILMLPQEIDGNLKTILNVDNKSYQYYLPANELKNGEISSFIITVDDEIKGIDEEIYFGDYKGTYLGINYQDAPIYWADRNVGADTTEDAGYYFAWGATEPEKDFTQDNFVGSNSTGNISGTDADAAYKLMGYGWRLPSNTEMTQLLNLKKEKTSIGDVQGWTFTAENGKQIFLPCAGCYYGDRCFSFGEAGYYWTANASSTNTAYVLNLSWLSAFMQNEWSKVQGCSIRGVISL